MQNLIIGITLVAISIGSVIFFRPRNGKTARFVAKPLLGPLFSILIVMGLTIGIFLVVTYFSSIDDATLSGVKRR